MLRLVLILAAAAQASSLLNYKATKADFKTLEEGVADALKVQESVFPEGIDQIDFVLYDAKYLYVYSRSPSYKFKKVKKWGEYQVYRVPHHGKATEKELARCAGLGRGGLTKILRGKISEYAFECAPWATFEKIQKKRRSIYQYKEGYLASIVHEYGHQYMEQQPGGIPAVVAIDKAVTEVPYSTNRASVVNEGFATYCELKASKALYPAHYARLAAQAKDLSRPDDAYGHDTGLRLAAKVLDAESPKKGAK